MAVELLQQLQPPWDYGVTDDGRIFFVNEEAGITTWLHPGRMHPIQSGYATSTDLPRGWEKSVTPEGAPYYIDHINRRTTFYHPVTNQSAAVNIPLENQEPDHFHQDSSDYSKVSRRVIPVNKVIDSTPSSPKVPESEEVTLRGWLHKQERGPLKSWKRRWCVLSDYCLFYYKDRAQEQGQASGSILLPSYKVSPCSKEDSISRKYAFKAEHANMRTYYFAAENESEMSQWIYHISLATNLQRDPSILAKNEHLKEQNNNNNTSFSEGGFEDRSWMSPRDRRPPGEESDSNSFIEHPDASMPQIPGFDSNQQLPYGHERQTSDLSEDVPWYTTPHDRVKNPYADPPHSHNAYPPPYDDHPNEYSQNNDPNAFNSYKQGLFQDSFYSDQPTQMDSPYSDRTPERITQPETPNNQLASQSPFRSPDDQHYPPEDSYISRQEQQYQSPQDSYRSPPQDSYGSHPQDNYRSPPQEPHRSPEYAHQEPESYRSPSEQYRSPHDSQYQSPHDPDEPRVYGEDPFDRSYLQQERPPPGRPSDQHYQSPEYLRPDQSFNQPHSRQSSNASSQPPWASPADSSYRYNSEKVVVLDTSLPRSVQSHSLDSSDGGNQSMVDAKNQRNIRNSMERAAHHPAPLPGMRPTKRPGSVSSVDSIQRLREWQEKMRNSPRPVSSGSQSGNRDSLQDPNYHSQTPIYENLVASQGLLTPDDVPTRPPLPAQYRDQIARDIAESKTPTSRDDMLTAVDRERVRVDDMPVFQYPEPQMSPNSHRMDEMGPDGIEADMRQKLGQQVQRYHPDGEDSERTDSIYRGGPPSQRSDPYYGRPPGQKGSVVTSRPPPSVPTTSLYSSAPLPLNSESFNRGNVNPTVAGLATPPKRVPPTGGQEKDAQPESPFIPIFARNQNQSKASTGPLVLQSEEAPLQHPKAQFAKPLGRAEPNRFSPPENAEKRSSLANSGDELYASVTKDVMLDRKPGVVEIPGHSQSKSAFQQVNSQAAVKSPPNNKQKVILMKSESPKSARRRLEDEYPNIDVEPQVKAGYSIAEIKGPDIRSLVRQRPKSMPGPDYDLSGETILRKDKRTDRTDRRRPRSMEGLLGTEFIGLPDFRKENEAKKVEEKGGNQRQSRLQQKMQAPAKQRSRSLERGMEELRRRMDASDGAVSDSEAMKISRRSGDVIDDLPLSYRPKMPDAADLKPLHINTQLDGHGATPAVLPGPRPRPKSMPYSVDTTSDSMLRPQRPFSLAAAGHKRWGNSALFENKANWGNTPPWREEAYNKAYISSVFEETPKSRGHRKTKSWDSVLDNPSKDFSSTPEGAKEGQGVQGSKEWDSYLKKKAQDESEGENRMPSKRLFSGFQGPAASPADTRGQQEAEMQSRAAPLSPSLSAKMQHPGPENQRHNISTIKEDPDMPDEEILDTKTLQELQSHLKDPRMRLSISAADLVGKSHEELVLLLIQLRRSQTRLTDVKNWYRTQLDVSREYEKEYKKQRHDSIGRLSEALEEEHEHFQTLRKHNSQLEKQLDVNKPLVNLVDNLVTMGSLYGGDNLLYASEYKQYQARPGEIQPKRLIEFSRQHQEDKLQREQEEGIRQLTEDEANLEEKLQLLFELDRELQDQSFAVTSLQEDRELLEKALSGVRGQEDREDNPRILRNLHHQRQTLQTELSKVRQQLADAFKLLEEKSAENARVEQEVVLLRKKIAQGLARNAMSTANMGPDTVRARQQLEKEVTNIQSLMEGLSQQGAKISKAMRTIRHEGPEESEQKTPSPYVLVTGRTYAETDLDNMETIDLANNQKIDLYKKSAPTEIKPNPQVVHDPTISPWTPDSYVVRTSLGLQQQMATRLPPTGAEHQQPYGSGGVPNGQNGQDSITYAKQYHMSDMARSSPNVNSSSSGSYSDRGRPQHHSVQASQSTSALYENLVDRDRYDPGHPRDSMSDQYSPLDIQEADENTKRFYGIIPRESKPKYTVRDVKKRESERKGRDRVKRLSNGDTGSDSEYPDYKNIPPAVSWNMERSQSFPHGIGLYEEPPPPRSHSTDFKTNTPPHMHSAQRRQVPKAKQEEKRLSATERLFPKKPSSQDGSDRIQRMSDIYSPRPYSGSSSSLNQSTGSRSNTQSPRDPGRTRSGPDFYRTSPATVATVRPVQNSQFNASLSNKGYGDQKTPDWGIPMSSTKERRPRRHQTISSSEPVKLEQIGRWSKSSPDDPLSSRLGRMNPDIVRSDTALDKEFDDWTIEKEVLYMPQKVEIPERYMPDNDEDFLTMEEKLDRAEKADRIRKMLAAHSLQEWAKDELEEASSDVHRKVEYEKRQRETILDIRGALAKEVTRKSRQIAERTSSFNQQRDDLTNPEVNYSMNDYDYNHFVPIA